MKYLNFSLLSVIIALPLMFDLFLALFWWADRTGNRPWPFTPGDIWIFQVIVGLNAVAVFAVAEAAMKKKGISLEEYRCSYLVFGILIGFLIAWLGTYNFDISLWWREIKR